MLRITDKRFVYTNAASTDLKAKFKKIIAEQKKQQAAQSTVVPMRKAGK
jgi:hypothetical protein